METKKEDWALFCAGVAAPFVSFAVGVAVSALLGVLIALGAIGLLVAVIISIIDGLNEVEELVAHVVRKEIPFIVGFIFSTIILVSTISP